MYVCSLRPRWWKYLICEVSRKPVFICHCQRMHDAADNNLYTGKNICCNLRNTDENIIVLLNIVDRFKHTHGQPAARAALSQCLWMWHTIRRSSTLYHNDDTEEENIWLALKIVFDLRTVVVNPLAVVQKQPGSDNGDICFATFCPKAASSCLRVKTTANSKISTTHNNLALDQYQQQRWKKRMVVEKGRRLQFVISSRNLKWCS